MLTLLSAIGVRQARRWWARARTACSSRRSACRLRRWRWCTSSTHRYDGVPLWNLRGTPGVHEAVWLANFVSFFFLYPSTFNLLEARHQLCAPLLAEC